MAKEKIEETIENPEEKETSEEKPQKEEDLEIPQEEGKETPEKPETTPSELEEKNKRLYARMKKAEEETKKAKEESEKAKKEKPSTPTDVFDLAKTVSALRDYFPEELDFIQMMSKAKGISPEEAAKTEEAKLYISARRQKVEAEKKTPEPSTKVSPSEKSVDKITVEDMRKMSPEDRRKTLIKKGWIKERR